MSTLLGRYVRTFAEADMFILEDVSLNAPYPFFWGKLKRIEGRELVVDGAGDEFRLRWRATKHGDRATITMQDPVFGSVEYEVHPFLQFGGQPLVPTLQLGEAGR